MGCCSLKSPPVKAEGKHPFETVRPGTLLHEGEYHIEDVGATFFKVSYPGQLRDQDQDFCKMGINDDGKIKITWRLDDAALASYLEMEAPVAALNDKLSDAPTAPPPPAGGRDVPPGMPPVLPPSMPQSTPPMSPNIPPEMLVGMPPDMPLDVPSDMPGMPLVVPPGMPADTPPGQAANDALEVKNPLLPAETVVADAAPGKQQPTLKFMYTNACRLEYFSVRHQSWLPAVVEVKVAQGKADDTELPDIVVMYEVTIHGAGARLQEKRNVPLHRLRAPLQAGELVEVLSLRGGGMWLSGSVQGTPAPAATHVGYRVSLATSAGSKDLLEPVPATRLRRRFPLNLPLCVYDGFVKGWRNAVSSATPDGLGGVALEVRHEETSASSPLIQAPLRFRDSDGVPSYSFSEGQYEQEKDRESPLTQVPVRFLDSEGVPSKESSMVPSYLVRASQFANVDQHSVGAVRHDGLGSLAPDTGGSIDSAAQPCKTILRAHEDDLVELTARQAPHHSLSLLTCYALPQDCHPTCVHSGLATVASPRVVQEIAPVKV